MNTIARRRTTGTGSRTERVARRGMWGIARIVSLITMVVVGLIVIGILLVVLEANRDNAIVGFVDDVARWLVDPFSGIFSLDERKAEIAVNWGLAALVYAIVGGVIASLLARAGLAAADRRDHGGRRSVAY